MNKLFDFLGASGLEAIMGVLSPYLPTNEATKLEIQAKLEQIQVDGLREKGNYIEKLGVIRDLIIPLFLGALLFMYIFNYISDFVHAQFLVEAPNIIIDGGLVEICKNIIWFLFGSKTISRFSNSYVEKHYK